MPKRPEVILSGEGLENYLTEVISRSPGFELRSERETVFGIIYFRNDGVQCWPFVVIFSCICR